MKIQEKIEQGLQQLPIWESTYNQRNSCVTHQNFPIPKIDLPPHLKRSASRVSLAWGRETLEYFLSDLEIDFFHGDTKGIYYLMHTYFPSLYKTLFREALIGGVSFAWVLEDESSQSGSEILVRSASKCFVLLGADQTVSFAMTKVADSEYLVYSEGNFYTFTEDRKNSLELLEIEGKVIPFSQGHCYGKQKIGKSLFSPSFYDLVRSASSLTSLFSQANLLDVSNKNILLAQGVEPQLLDSGEEVAPLTEESLSGIKALFASSSAELELKSLKELNAKNFSSLLELFAHSAAAEVSIDPSIFGFPVKSFSQETYVKKLQSIQNDLSHAINSLAHEVFKNYTGHSIENSTRPVFKKSIPIEKFGAIGDSLFKLSDLGFTEEEIHTLAKKTLGVSEREEKLKIIPKRKEVKND